jgi:hypothetical protein
VVIWLTWRQQRAETLIAAFVLALVVAIVVPTGLHIASVYDDNGIGGCLANSSRTCEGTVNEFIGRWDSLVNLVGWFNLVPAVIGILFATPLVLDFERGTHRLAWTQSVTRGRWLTVRLLVIGAGAVICALMLTAFMTWWRRPLDRAGPRMPDGFDVEGIVPVFYTLFAAALVLALGAVLRRTATAIGLAFVLFFVLRIGLLVWGRQHYKGAVHASWTRGSGPDLRHAWVLSENHGLRVAAGYPSDRSAIQSCFENGVKGNVDAACLAKHHVVEYGSALYQPASRFWLFQGIEAGIFASLTIALVLFSIWWIRKRIN